MDKTRRCATTTEAIERAGIMTDAGRRSKSIHTTDGWAHNERIAIAARSGIARKGIQTSHIYC